MRNYRQNESAGARQRQKWNLKIEFSNIENTDQHTYCRKCYEIMT